MSPHLLDMEPDTGIRNKSTNFQVATDSVKITV